MPASAFELEAGFSYREIVRKGDNDGTMDKSNTRNRISDYRIILSIAPD